MNKNMPAVSLQKSFLKTLYFCFCVALKRHSEECAQDGQER